MATVRDVAQLAGVSVATVSRVMTGAARVAEATAERVRAAILQLDYVPNHPASALGGSKTARLFAVMVPNLTNPYFAELLDIIELEASQHGFSVLFFNARQNEQTERSCLESCRKQQVDGLLMVPIVHSPEAIARLESLPFPVVILTQPLPRLTSVFVDHAAGGALAAEHLVRTGHTRIGFLGSNRGSEEKLVGFRGKLAELGYPLSDDDIIDLADGHHEECGPCIRSYLARHRPLTLSAIFASNDVAALQMMEALIEQGYRVPEEVVVVGFDNTPLAKAMGITSIAQPMQEIGRLAFQEILALRSQTPGAAQAQHLSLAPRLVVRESTLKVHRCTAELSLTRR